MDHMRAARHIGKIVLTTHPLRSGHLRQDGTYLVTGGLGGIGCALAEWLAEHGAGVVVLNGRRAPDAAAQQGDRCLARPGVQDRGRACRRDRHGSPRCHAHADRRVPVAASRRGPQRRRAGGRRPREPEIGTASSPSCGRRCSVPGTCTGQRQTAISTSSSCFRASQGSSATRAKPTTRPPTHSLTSSQPTGERSGPPGPSHCLGRLVGARRGGGAARTDRRAARGGGHRLVHPGTWFQGTRSAAAPRSERRSRGGRLAGIRRIHRGTVRPSWRTCSLSPRSTKTSPRRKTCLANSPQRRRRSGRNSSRPSCSESCRRC